MWPKDSAIFVQFSYSLIHDIRFVFLNDYFQEAFGEVLIVLRFDSGLLV